MWDKRKLLLAATVFTAVYYKVAAESAKPQDMAPDAVDDLYNGCREKAMEKFIHSGLLKQELHDNEGFQKAWNTSIRCSKLIPEGIKEHTAALVAYANGDAVFLKTFHNEVKTKGVNVSIYENDFHFKSLHFLLMDSMKLLNPDTEKCQTVFFLPDDDEKYKAEKGSKVRFGGFTTVSSSFTELEKDNDLAGVAIFNITSCFFANLGDNICDKDKNMVLLSPAEVFTVEEITETTDGDGDTFSEIVLKHSKLDSSHNCYIFSRSPADVSTQWLVMVLVALSLFVFNC